MTQPPTRIEEKRAGKGPVLVILHGLFGSADNFRSLALHLERHWQVARLDLPGHGQSGTLPTLSIEAMAEAICRHLLDQGTEECHLLGHSLGGKVAMHMASAGYGLHVEKLIVADIAPRLYPPHHASILEALSSVQLASIGSRSDAEKQLRSGIPDAGVRAFLLKSLDREQDRFFWQFDLAALRRDYDLLRQVPAFPNPVTIPTLFIKGGNSDYLSNSDELTIRSHFTQPHFQEIPGTGHWLHAEKPALFTRICEQFLSGSQPN